MERLLRWMLVLACLLMLVLPLLADDDEEGGNGGNTLGPNLQWQLACASWDKRDYNTSAVLNEAYATKNPDEPNVLEAWWRTYYVYRSYRPNPERKKSTLQKALDACDRWEKKYAQTDKNRAAGALWYRSQFLECEGQRVQAINVLQSMFQKYSGSNYDAGAYWTLGEWLREAKRFQEAIPNYQGYRKLAGYGDQPAMALFREGWCYEELKDKDNAIEAYKSILGKGWNWGWWQVAWGALDAAERCQRLGDEQTARALALKIVDNSPDWGDLKVRARLIMGVKTNAERKMWIYPHLYYHYSSENMSVTGGTKVNFSFEFPLLLRMYGITKDTPFKGTLTVKPKADVSKKADNPMKEAQSDDGKKIFVADITNPNPNGGIWQDSWYNLLKATETATLPDGLMITRKWEKAGNTWGESTIRIQSNGRWHVWVYLPNNQTSPDNITGSKPNEVNDNGKTFRWYDWYDMTQGVTIKFPVEVGANVAEYYPKVYLLRYPGNTYQDKSGNGAEATYDLKDYTVTLKSADAFPYTFNFPTQYDVTLAEISK